MVNKRELIVALPECNCAVRVGAFMLRPREGGGERKSAKRLPGEKDKEKIRNSSERPKLLVLVTPRNVYYREAPSAMTGAPSGAMPPAWSAEPTSRRSTRVHAPWWRHLRRAEREKEKQDRVNELRAEQEKEDKEERETGFGPL